MQNKLCPVCNYQSTNKSLGPLAQDYEINCEVCGLYNVTDLDLSRIQKDDEEFLAKWGHYLFKMQKNGTPPLIDQEVIEYLREKFSMPSLKEQEQNLILFLGDNTTPGKSMRGPNHKKLIYAIGAVDSASTTFLLKELDGKKLILSQPDAINATAIIRESYQGAFSLTMDGWDYYNELKKGRSESNKAFMAMQFNNGEINTAYNIFKETLAEVGFRLNTVEPRTGLIDDHIRVDIRNARFIIADLTNCNRGAYWEAGYAEGLGKKVIYTCEKSYFDNKENGGTHFDTNHCQTILWKKDDFSTALEELKYVVRYEFPETALMEE